MESSNPLVFLRFFKTTLCKCTRCCVYEFYIILILWLVSIIFFYASFRLSIRVQLAPYHHYYRRQHAIGSLYIHYDDDAPSQRVSIKITINILWIFTYTRRSVAAFVSSSWGFWREKKTTRKKGKFHIATFLVTPLQPHPPYSNMFHHTHRQQNHDSYNFRRLHYSRKPHHYQHVLKTHRNQWVPKDLNKCQIHHHHHHIQSSGSVEEETRRIFNYKQHSIDLKIIFTVIGDQLRHTHVKMLTTK